MFYDVLATYCSVFMTKICLAHFCSVCILQRSTLQCAIICAFVMLAALCYLVKDDTDNKKT